jgi:hypothetical protein
MILIAPHDRPQVFSPPLNGVQHPLASQVVAALSKHGSQPVGFWRIINTLANEQKAESRGHRRSWRLRFLCAVRQLCRAGILFRHGLLISTSNFVTTPRRRGPRRVSRPEEKLAYRERAWGSATQAASASAVRLV